MAKIYRLKKSESFKDLYECPLLNLVLSDLN